MPRFTAGSLTDDVMEGIVGIEVERIELMPLHNSVVIFMTQFLEVLDLDEGYIYLVGYSFKR